MRRQETLSRNDLSENTGTDKADSFADEGYKVTHKGAGDLLMATAGLANNCHSQFAVAMSHLSEFETKHVIFGKVCAAGRLTCMPHARGQSQVTYI